jgi:hypothetical protein
MPSTPPADLLPLREAARLVDRGPSTLRAWIRAGDLPAYRGAGTAPENAPVLVSRAELLHAAGTTGKAPRPGRPAPPAYPASPPGAGEALVLRAELAGARAVVEAQRATVAALEARARDLAAALDAERATVAGLRAELDALRGAGRLPWWRRLLGAPRPAAELPGAGEA